MKKIFKYYNKIFNESKYVLFLNITDRIFFFVIFVLIAREYPTDIYGKLITLFAISNVFITIFDLGLPIFLQREISISKNQSSQLFSQIVITNLVIFIAYFASTFICYKLLYSDISLDLFMATVTIVYLFSLINIFYKTLSALRKFRDQFQLSLISRLLTILFCIIAVIFFKIGLIWLLYIILLGCLFNILIFIKALRLYHVLLSYKFFKIHEVLKILKKSYPLGLAVVFTFLYDKIDILIISKLTDFNQVAFYHIGYGIYKASSLSFLFLFVAGFTKVSYLSRNKKAVGLFFKKYLKTVLVICFLLSIVLILGADIFIRLIYSYKFQNSIIVLQILSFAIIGLGLNNLTGTILIGIGFFKTNMFITLSALIINIILNLIFIPQYGIIAASVIMIVTEYYLFAGGLFFILRYIRK